MLGAVAHNTRPGHVGVTLQANGQSNALILLRVVERSGLVATEIIIGNASESFFGEGGQGRKDVGAILRGFLPYGQVSAGISFGNNLCFAPGIVLCMVNEPCDSTLPASHKHLLFRTPSFRGQDRVSNTDLPALFFGRTADPRRQKPAQSPVSPRLILNNKARFRHLLFNSTRNQKGQYTCEFHEFSLRSQPVAGWQPAVIQPGNRRCLAAVSGLSELRFSARIRSLALRSVQPATCCIARRKTTVTDTGFPGRAPSRSSFDGTPLRGISPATAFSFVQNTKTEDVPCSTRS